MEKKEKLALYNVPYEIIRRFGQVAYELELPPRTLHSSSSVSCLMLRKCIGDPSSIASIEDIQVMEDLTYEKIPIAISDRQVERLRNKEVG